MPTDLTPEERTLRARIAANTRWAGEDPVKATEPARAKGPGSDSYWLQKVDPDRTLPDSERQRRAQSAKTAHYQRLALKSAKSRRKGGTNAA